MLSGLFEIISDSEILNRTPHIILTFRIVRANINILHIIYPTFILYCVSFFVIKKLHSLPNNVNFHTRCLKNVYLLSVLKFDEKSLFRMENHVYYYIRYGIEMS